MLIIRSTIFNIVHYSILVIASLVCCMLVPFPQKCILKAMKVSCYVIRFALKYIAGIEIEIRGQENLPQGGFIIAPKHQSAMETFFFPGFVNNAVYILKKELTNIPFFGWALKRVGCVGIDRSAGASALRKMKNGCGAILDKGRTVVVFPEGTRTKAGQTTKYQSGAAILYSTFDVPFIPVALNSGLFWSKKAYIKYPGKIIIEFLPAMPKGLSKQEFVDELKNRIETACQKINQETFENYPYTRKNAVG